MQRPLFHRKSGQDGGPRCSKVKLLKRFKTPSHTKKTRKALRTQPSAKQRKESFQKFLYPDLWEIKGQSLFRIWNITKMSLSISWLFILKVSLKPVHNVSSYFRMRQTDKRRLSHNLRDGANNSDN